MLSKTPFNPMYAFFKIYLKECMDLLLDKGRQLQVGQPSVK